VVGENLGKTVDLVEEIWGFLSNSAAEEFDRPGWSPGIQNILARKLSRVLIRLWALLQTAEDEGPAKRPEDRIQSLVDEMFESPAPFQPIAALVSAGNRHDSGAADEFLRSGLESGDKVSVRHSLLGLNYWLALSERRLLNPPEDSTLDLVFQNLRLRRNPGLLGTLQYVIVFVREFPRVLSESRLDSIRFALLQLQSETSLDEDSKQVAAQSETVVECRLEAARLAKLLTEYFETRSESPFDVLEDWKQIAESSRLRRIRNVWAVSSED
jgi:hypothetical protein